MLNCKICYRVVSTEDSISVYRLVESRVVDSTWEPFDYSVVTYERREMTGEPDFYLMRTEVNHRSCCHRISKNFFDTKK